MDREQFTDDIMSFVYKLFLGNEAIMLVLIGYMFLAGTIFFIQHIDNYFRGG